VAFADIKRSDVRARVTSALATVDGLRPNSRATDHDRGGGVQMDGSWTAQLRWVPQGQLTGTGSNGAHASVGSWVVEIAIRVKADADGDSAQTTLDALYDAAWKAMWTTAPSQNLEEWYGEADADMRRINDNRFLEQIMTFRVVVTRRHS